MTINLKKEGSPAKVQNSFDVRKYFHIFVQSHAVICRDMTGGVWDIDIQERLFCADVLTHWNFATFRYSRNEATVDAMGYAFYLVCTSVRIKACIPAWASALLVLLYRASEGLNAWNGQGKFHAFFVSWCSCP